MRDISSKTAWIMLILLLPACALAAGLTRPREVGDEFSHNEINHLFYYPSPFERVDTLNGRYNMMFPDVSLPGDGGLNLEIWHVYNPYISDEWDTPGTVAVLDEFMYGASVPSGIGWNIFNESISVGDYVDDWYENVQYGSTNGYEAQPIFYAAIFTQDGMMREAFPCGGPGCSFNGEDSWSKYTAACLPGEQGPCYERKVLFVTNDNWKLIVTMQAPSGDEHNMDDYLSASLKALSADLYLPDGTIKHYENPCPNGADWLDKCDNLHGLALTRTTAPSGAQINVTYVSEEDYAKYGSFFLPTKITMPTAGGKYYEVDFIYQDIHNEINAYENYNPDPPIDTAPCCYPRTWLKRLDVKLNDQYLYSRYFTYYHFPKYAYQHFFFNDEDCEFFGADSFYLTDSFILDGQGSPVDSDFNAASPGTAYTDDFSGDPLSSFLAEKSPLAYWGFKYGCYYGYQGQELEGCTTDTGFFDDSFLNTVITPYGQKIDVSYYGFPENSDNHSISNWPQQAGDPDPVYDPDLFTILDSNTCSAQCPDRVGHCDGSSRRAVFFVGPRISQRTENPPISTGESHRLVAGAARVDKFESLQLTGDTTPLMETVIYSSTTYGESGDLSQCFAKPGPEGNPQLEMYSTKTVYHYFILQDVTEDGQLWKLYTPVDQKTYALDGSQEPIQSVQYGWTAINHPFITEVDTPYVPNKWFTHVNHYYPFSPSFIDQGVCYLNGYYQDITPKVPVLNSLTITQDGITYGSTLTGQDDNHGLPSDIVSRGAGGVSRHTEIGMRHSWEAPGEYFLGLTEGIKSSLSFSKGSGQTVVYDSFDRLMPKNVTVNGVLTKLEYDTKGNVASVTDANGNRDTYSNYYFGRPKYVSSGNGTMWSEYIYGPTGGVTVARVGGRQIMTGNYDALGNPKNVSRPGMNDAVYVYIFSEEDVASTTHPGFGYHKSVAGRRTTVGNRVYEERYDGWGRVWETIEYPKNGSSVEGVRSFVIRDACGQVRTSFPTHRPGNQDISITADGVYQSPIGAYQSYYDAFGRPVLAFNAMGQYTQYDYAGSPDGLMVTRTMDSINGSILDGNSSHSSTYEDLYQGPSPDELYLVSSHGPKIDGADTSATKTITYEYDRSGRMVGEETQASGGAKVASSAEIDSRGWATSASATERGTRQFPVRDGAGRVNMETQAGVYGDIRYEYDGLGRVTVMTLTGPGAGVYGADYRSDGTGLLESDSGWWGQVSYGRDYEYDPTSLMLSKVTDTYMHHGHALSFEAKYYYDGYGQGSTVEYTGAGTVVYEKDALGRVSGVKRKNAQGTEETLAHEGKYYPDGTMMQIVTGDNVMQDFYQVYESGAPTFLGYYPAGGSAPVRNDEGTIYALGPGPVPSNKLWMEQYQKDAGNGKLTFDNYYDPLWMQFQGGSWDYTVTASYDDEQQLTDAHYLINIPAGNSVHYRMQYDGLGNRWSVDNNQCSFIYTLDQSNNRLMSVSDLQNGNTLEALTYDKMGNVTSNQRHTFQWDLMGRLVSADGGAAAGGVTFYYDAGGRKIMKETPDQLWAWFYGAGSEPVCERLYSLPDYTEVGSVYYYYGPSGLLATDDNGVFDNTSFVGREYDYNLDLLNLGARWYDPALGRFLSPDPIPSSLNQYAYAGNNPFVYQDPNGLSSRFLNFLDPDDDLNDAGIVVTPGQKFSQLYSHTNLPDEHEVQKIGEAAGTGLLIYGTIGTGVGVVGAAPDIGAAATSVSMWSFSSAPWIYTTAVPIAADFISAPGTPTFYQPPAVMPAFKFEAVTGEALLKEDRIIGHHNIFRVLGGFKKQRLYDVLESLHILFHRLTNKNMREAGLPALTGRGYSRLYWREYMHLHPGSQSQAFEVLLQSARQFDAQHGTQFEIFLRDAIIQGAYEKR